MVRVLSCRRMRHLFGFNDRFLLRRNDKNDLFKMSKVKQSLCIERISCFLNAPVIGEVQECDATGDAACTKAGLIKILYLNITATSNKAAGCLIFLKSK